MSCFCVFSQIFKGDVVFIKNEKPYSYSIDYEGPNVAFSIVLAMILKIYVFRMCVFNDFRSRKSCALVKLKAQKHLKSLCESDIYFLFSMIGHLEKRRTS